MYDMFLFFGHGEGDNGAINKSTTELAEVKKLVTRINKLLVDKGVKVLTNLSTLKNNYHNNLTKGQKFKYNMGATIHLNSFGGVASGTEIIVPSKEKSLNVEKYILDNLVKLGFINRGLKSRDYTTEKFVNRVNGASINSLDYYKEIRESWSNGNSLSIIEVCFISSATDMVILKNEFEKICKIIANGYLKEMGKDVYSLEPNVKSQPTNVNVQPPTSKTFKVQVGSFTNKDNAEKLKRELEQKGYKPFIV